MNKFNIRYNTSERGLPTLFKYQYFTIDAAQRKGWDYQQLYMYLGKYRLKVSGHVLQASRNSYIKDLLLDLNNTESYFEVSRNNTDRYKQEKQYIKCRIPIYVLNCFKKVFISTLVYDSVQQEIPTPEHIDFCFNPCSKEVEIMGLSLYEPDNNPYYRYARNAVDSMSVEAIGLSKYSIEKGGIKDFYDKALMTPWKTVDKLSKEPEAANHAGIYMLYDSTKNHFYVGKSISIIDRIFQHMKNQYDPIQNFSHYRYSIISGEYYEFLYLIENAAIHDFAWLLEMPKAKKYAPSLAKMNVADLNNCKLVNTAEHQTRKQ